MTESTRFRLRDSGLNWRTIDDQVIVLDLETSNYLSLNETGSLLWSALSDGATREELVERLLAEFEIGPETALADVGTFIASCQAQRLVVVVSDS